MTNKNLKGIVEEIEIRGKRIGIIDNLDKIAVLNPRELVRKQDQLKYDEMVSQLQNKGYKIIYNSAEKPKKLARNKMYDILASHQSSSEWKLWSQTDLKDKLKYING